MWINLCSEVRNVIHQKDLYILKKCFKYRFICMHEIYPLLLGFLSNRRCLMLSHLNDTKTYEYLTGLYKIIPTSSKISNINDFSEHNFFSCSDQNKTCKLLFLIIYMAIFRGQGRWNYYFD